MALIGRRSKSLPTIPCVMHVLLSMEFGHNQISMTLIHQTNYLGNLQGLVNVGRLNSLNRSLSSKESVALVPPPPLLPLLQLIKAKRLQRTPHAIHGNNGTSSTLAGLYAT